jgi:hypothetical protein
MIHRHISVTADERGEIAAWVLVLLMTAGLVISVWSLAQERLLNIVSTALSNVCGSVGC